MEKGTVDDSKETKGQYYHWPFPFAIFLAKMTVFFFTLPSKLPSKLFPPSTKPLYSSCYLQGYAIVSVFLSRNFPLLALLLPHHLRSILALIAVYIIHIIYKILCYLLSRLLSVVYIVHSAYNGYLSRFIKPALCGMVCSFM